MTNRAHMGARSGGKSAARRCGTLLMARVRATLDAADHVAGEFDRAERIKYLAQAIRTEHPDVAEADSEGLAELYVVVST